MWWNVPRNNLVQDSFVPLNLALRTQPRAVSESHSTISAEQGGFLHLSRTWDRSFCSCRKASVSRYQETWAGRYLLLQNDSLAFSADLFLPWRVCVVLFVSVCGVCDVRVVLFVSVWCVCVCVCVTVELRRRGGILYTNEKCLEASRHAVSLFPATS